MDIVLVCLTNVGCGMIGAPWMCAATVRSVTHVSSVTLMSTTHAPGEKPHIITVRGIKYITSNFYETTVFPKFQILKTVICLKKNLSLEQRVSALVVAALVGASVLMAPILQLLPVAILFGVFLYMGISSIEGIQFFERLKLFLMPVKYHPQTAYVLKVGGLVEFIY